MRAASTLRACPICQECEARRIWPEAGYAYVRCTRCGAVFADLTAGDYARERHNVWDDPRPADAAVEFYGPARRRAHDQLLDGQLPFGNRRLLDVGCGLGFFLARARERGWDVHGIDTSPAWVELANARLGDGHVTLAGPAGARGSYALITAWDVLEHVFDPVPFLVRLAELLAPGGRLFIRTPNLAYVYPVYAGRRWLLGQDVGLGPTNHVVYFTARTLARALGAAGLRATAWPVLVPPQVGPWVAGKNAYSRLAHELAGRTGLVIGSDLDVICAAA